MVSTSGTRSDSNRCRRREIFCSAASAADFASSSAWAWLCRSQASQAATSSCKEASRAERVSTRCRAAANWDSSARRSESWRSVFCNSASTAGITPFLL